MCFRMVNADEGCWNGGTTGGIKFEGVIVMVKIVPVARERYAGKGWRRPTSFSFAAAEAMIPLSGSEFSNAVAAMPITCPARSVQGSARRARRPDSHRRDDSVQNLDPGSRRPGRDARLSDRLRCPRRRMKQQERRQGDPGAVQETACRSEVLTRPGSGRHSPSPRHRAMGVSSALTSRHRQERDSGANKNLYPCRSHRERERPPKL